MTDIESAYPVPCSGCGVGIGEPCLIGCPDQIEPPDIVPDDDTERWLWRFADWPVKTNGAFDSSGCIVSRPEDFQSHD